MPKQFLGVGWGFPVNLHTASDNTVEIQLAEYEESVRQAIWIILGTAKGERVMRPEFGCGIYDLVFELNSASTAGPWHKQCATHCSHSSRALMCVTFRCSPRTVVKCC